jgi:hypothetical protein
MVMTAPAIIVPLMVTMVMLMLVFRFAFMFMVVRISMAGLVVMCGFTNHFTCCRTASTTYARAHHGTCPAA